MQCINGEWKNVGFYGKICFFYIFCHQKKHNDMGYWIIVNIAKLYRCMQLSHRKKNWCNTIECFYSPYVGLSILTTRVFYGNNIVCNI